VRIKQTYTIQGDVMSISLIVSLLLCADKSL